jgi:phosphatidylinositol alpha-mannosyltransferase
MGRLPTDLERGVLPVRIALVSPYDITFPGGVSGHVLQLGRSLRALGHATTVIAPASARPGFESPDNLIDNLITAGRVVCVPTNGSVARITLSLGLSSRLKRILRDHQFDVVHLHEPFIPLLPFLVLRHSDAVNIATFHAYSRNELGYRRGRFLLRRFFARLHGRIAVSDTARSFVARHFPGTYEIVPNGVDLDRFQNAVPIPDLVDGTPNILFVGRLDERKGFRYLLRAFAELRRSGLSARLIVVGAYGEAQRRHYEARAAAVGLSGLVFAGYASADELPRYYQSADVVCAPSLGGESFGVVLAEAMAAGKPIVASRIAGYQEVVEHEVEGLLVPPADTLSLCEALRRVVTDPDLREGLGRRGRIKATHLAWPVIAQKVLQSYNTAMMVKREDLMRESRPRLIERLNPETERAQPPILEGSE